MTLPGAKAATAGTPGKYFYITWGIKICRVHKLACTLAFPFLNFLRPSRNDGLWYGQGSHSPADTIIGWSQ